MTTKDVLVVGGGIAGMTAALELSRLGYRVHLVERNPSIGGNLAKLSRLFPTLDDAREVLVSRIADVAKASKINLLTYSEVQSISGKPGDFKVEVFMRPRGVNVAKCTACGKCVEVCPISVPNEFEEGLTNRKAIYIPFREAYPRAYTIDFSVCIRCGECVKICPEGAVDLADEAKLLSLHVGAIIIATGYQLYDARKLEVYGYGLYENVITSMQLERMLSQHGPTGGRVKRVDGVDAKKVAILHCAGSRDRNYVSYCSRICCMYILKQAYLLRQQGVDVTLYYMDVRANYRGGEDFYAKVQEAGISFIRGKVAEITKGDGGKLVIVAEDTLSGGTLLLKDEYDVVVLATPMIPSAGLKDIAEKIGVLLDVDGFVAPRHLKTDPVSTSIEGVFACGCALGPKDVGESVSEALAAALKTSFFLKEDNAQ
ncbi:MAG: CoB--CoM heterodisulfide reductase iron-sulfur subunit A family protein [Candidatus Nezhaarchaeota archaeon]|nr:CoB--CoM heterodisulfide reductase iron-sulfur subunit A family protein [Candidatus Nezhaarchaeota archaeon]MCX8142431.1 CoB--CoM heterodisulfide reductase iron-sulfur subunit A family protein [Candidatus Nezhaarchaeota archaeon]MDW8050596.1 CoB--CoM heterodisulfide reductase iron-sulfur subunit A family protein [Nitrososphaerota archaeon]